MTQTLNLMSDFIKTDITMAKLWQIAQKTQKQKTPQNTFKYQSLNIGYLG